MSPVLSLLSESRTRSEALHPPIPGKNHEGSATLKFYRASSARPPTPGFLSIGDRSEDLLGESTVNRLTYVVANTTVCRITFAIRWYYPEDLGN